MSMGFYRLKREDVEGYDSPLSTQIINHNPAYWHCSVAACSAWARPASE